MAENQLHLPFTNKLKNLSFLAQSLMLTRLGVGIIRIVADLPVLNRSKDESPREKMQNLMERCFIELVGTVGGFIGLQSAMDLMSSVASSGIAHKDWISKVDRSGLSAENKAKVIGAFKKTFKIEPEAQISGRQLLARSILEKANLNQFVRTLNDPNLLALDQKTGHLKVGNALGADFLKAHTTQLFVTLNKKGVLSSLVGILFSAVVSGAPIQWFNDRVLRKKLCPYILDKVYGRIDQTPQASYSSSQLSQLMYAAKQTKSNRPPPGVSDKVQLKTYTPLHLETGPIIPKPVSAFSPAMKTFPAMPGPISPFNAYGRLI
ncbi:MAG: hypothetical protein AAGI66_02320 [Cyanobacteria bacterium P01_H01_bin.74]